MRATRPARLQGGDLVERLVLARMIREVYVHTGFRHDSRELRQLRQPSFELDWWEPADRRRTNPACGLERMVTFPILNFPGVDKIFGHERQVFFCWSWVSDFE